MRTYVVGRTVKGDVLAWVDVDGENRPLSHVRHHSENFEYGYGGSGPADLALSILADHFGEELDARSLSEGGWYVPDAPGGEFIPSRALQLCHQFKAAFVARRPRELPWRVTAAEIDAWIEGLATPSADGYPIL